MKKLKGSKGITLVALVITIIILLILAGISISALTGSGLFQKAEYTKLETRGASVEEAKDIWKMDVKIDQNSGTKTAQTLEELLEELEEKKLITKDEKKEIEANGQIKIGSRTIIFVEHTTVSEVVAGIKEVKGTEEDPMYVSTIEDLAIIAQEVERQKTEFEDVWIFLDRDLDFQSDSSYRNPNATTYIRNGVEVEFGDINADGKKTGIKEELTTGEGFFIIGKREWDKETREYIKTFLGNINGNNYTISNLYINKPNEDELGFIGYIGNDSPNKRYIIKNLNFDKIDVTVKGSWGTIAWITENTDIINCTTKGNIKSYGSHIAGIVGVSCDTNITKCTNYSDIDVTPTPTYGGDYYGGIVAEAWSYDYENIIENCYNYGNITVLEKIVGNKVRYTYGIGGIAGLIDDEECIVKKCANYGEMSGGKFVGGIVGDNEGGSIINCYNTGKVKGNHNVGGIVGHITYRNGIIKNCYNIGQVSGEINIAGISGGEDEDIETIIKNNYCLSTAAEITIIDKNNQTSTEGMKTEEEMKSDNFVDLLNKENTEIIWKKDIENVNNGYPVFN